MSNKPRVILSAAHTSISPGEVHKGLKEFDLTKKMLEFVAKHLEKKKFEFKPVPVDLQLLSRIDWINNTGYTEEEYDIMIEFHVNDGGGRGIEAWYSGDNVDGNHSKDLAEFLVTEFEKATKHKNNGAKSEKEHELGSLLILNQTKTASVAIELFFIDNDEDRKILQDDKKLEKECENIANLIEKYAKKLEEQKKKKPKRDPSPKSESKFKGLGDGFGDSFGDFGNFGNFGDFGGLGGNSAGGALASNAKEETSSSSLTMDREGRKKMINEHYEKYLGIEPKQSDLNYFLNIGISEDELMKKILKSKDHEEMVKDATEYRENKTKMQKQEGELVQLRSQVNDLKQMYQNFQKLLQHKNVQIKNMQHELVKRNIVRHGQYYDKQSIVKSNRKEIGRSSSSNQSQKSKKGFLKRLVG